MQQPSQIINIEKGSEEEKEGNKNKELDEMADAINELCRMLSKKSTLFSCEEWLKSLSEYITLYNRLVYTNITNCIFNLNEEEFGKFLTNLDSVVDYEIKNKQNRNDEKSAQRYKTVLKFHDHVNLAHRQYDMFNNKNKAIDELIDKRLSPALSTTTKELTSQLVGLVSIFTALSFIVFGGIESLANIFIVLSNADGSVYLILMVTLAWSLCISNLLFTFMYFVLNITKNNFEIDNNFRQKNLVQKYPIIFLSNFIIIMAFLVVSCIWFANMHGIGNAVFSYVLEHNTFVFWAGIILLVATLIVGGCVLRGLYNKNCIDNS